MTTQEIYDKTVAVLEQYIQALDSYTEEAFSKKPNEESWSVGQVYQHLLESSEHYFTYKIYNCLQKEKGTEEEGLTAIGEQIFEKGSFPPIQIKTPDKIKPIDAPKAKPKAHYAEKFEELKEHWKKLLPLVQANDGKFRTKHPAFGFLNAHEWFYTHEMHLKHHLLQIGRLKEFLQID